MEVMTENMLKALVENGNIDYKVDGSTGNIDLSKRRKYYDWLSGCSFIKDNGQIVKLILKENTESKNVFFEAYVAWYDKYGGFFVKGHIDLILKSIKADVYWDNKDNFETYRVSVDGLKRKKMK